MQFVSANKLVSKDGLPHNFAISAKAAKIFEESNINGYLDVANYNSTILHNYFDKLKAGKIHLADMRRFKKLFLVNSEDRTEWFLCFLCDSYESASFVHDLESNDDLVNYRIARDLYIDMCGLQVSTKKIIEVPDDFDPETTSYDQVKVIYDNIDNN